ncbi:MAG: hypothetical protein K1X68_10735 [Saprospiraceae bacterium]|nr:hypothetical protein [Saprospiraceae bacterium]HMW40031.1 hypothetical protein [Saprospiraceae bacterium]HMX87280.1 hypothetical protein [Saprospiraceae bacterium]HMZ40764.1 hypothetical protein [Saprospiraceae bacterium]HNA64885.1 hypothetical protein [Saprospiraceae bacterium]
MKKNLICFISCISLICFSCNILSGYKELDRIDLNRIAKKCIEYNSTECITSDSNYLIRLHKTTKDSLLFKDLYQPLQVHYFINSIRVSSLINCYIRPKGINDLDWNENNRLSEFPPRNLLDREFNINLRDYLLLFGDKYYNNTVTDAICIVWTNFFPKKSDKLIKTIQNSLGQRQSKNISVYLINIDLVYLKN